LNLRGQNTESCHAIEPAAPSEPFCITSSELAKELAADFEFAHSLAIALESVELKKRPGAGRPPRGLLPGASDQEQTFGVADAWAPGPRKRQGFLDEAFESLPGRRQTRLSTRPRNPGSLEMSQSTPRGNNP
jgi:hypothetical protein